MRKDKVYISGPMTDKATGKVSAENLAAFHHAERLLREMGYRRIVNPTRVWACRWPWLYRMVGYNLTLLYDLWLLMGCGQFIRFQAGVLREGRTSSRVWRFISEFGRFATASMKSSTRNWRREWRKGMIITINN